MPAGALQTQLTWAEDRASLRTDPSADPGAKTEGRAVTHSSAAHLPHPLGIGTKALNLRGTMPRNPRHDASLNSLTPTVEIPVAGEPGQFGAPSHLSALQSDLRTGMNI
jgi:hypothetical protein